MFLNPNYKCNNVHINFLVGAFVFDPKYPVYPFHKKNNPIEKKYIDVAYSIWELGIFFVNNTPI